MSVKTKEQVCGFVEDITRELNLTQYVNGVIEEVKKR